VSPSGLEDNQNQSPVADATGNDVSPSGLFANFNNRFDHITRNVLRKLKARRQKSWEYPGSAAGTQRGKICHQLTITEWWHQTTQPLSKTEAVSVFHRLTKVVKVEAAGIGVLGNRSQYSLGFCKAKSHSFFCEYSAKRYKIRHVLRPIRNARDRYV